MRMINRNFLFYFTVLSIVILFWIFNSYSFANSNADDDLEINARKQADGFLAHISGTPLMQAQSVSLSYEIHMVSVLSVQMKMDATVKMEKKENGYISILNLSKPEGKNVWSWLLLNLFGKQTMEYKELIESIETLLIERFRFRDHRFITDSLEEFLPDRKYYPNQTAIKVVFDYDNLLIKFWDDKTQSQFSESLAYTAQVGPMTGFFNYILFDKCDTKMYIINALKQVEDSPSLETVSAERKVYYLFESELVSLGFNNTGKHTQYPMSVYLERGNFLDIIYGENVYYQLAQDAACKYKVPYAARIEGIISKSKKRQKLKMLRKKYPDRDISEKELLAEVDDILAAKHVRVYLNHFSIEPIPGLN